MIFTVLLQRGEVAAEAAAGIYLEDRRCQLACLQALLQAQALPAEGLQRDAQQAIFDFNASLLSRSSNQQLQLLQRMIELIRVSLTHVHVLPM